MRVVTIGYGGRRPEDLVEILGLHGVRTVVDVRLRPERASLGAFARAASPERGIERRLREAGIAYVSRIELGNLFREREAWREPYRELLQRAGDLLLDPLRELEAPLGLLCAERRVADCHRGLIAEALAERGWEVVHVE
jgi:uncharacterized protein (DUF488 family)